MRRNMTKYGTSRQDGAVLLTCLVFLLVILGMLRFVISSARMEEEKAGIDLEIASAREAAQSAIAYAEYFILRQGALYCDFTNGSNCSDGKSAMKHVGELFNLSGDGIKNLDAMPGYIASDITYGAPVDKISSLMEKGLYTGKYIYDNARSCQPFWICVDWGTQAKSVHSSAKAQSSPDLRKYVSMECKNCVTNGTVNPRFVIERYTVGELSDNELNGLRNKGTNPVVFRITAVGFGRGTGTGSGLVNIGSGNNMTNVMLQSVYVVPGGDD